MKFELLDGTPYCSARGTTEYAQEITVLTKSEERVLRTFREYLMTPGQMLCFSGPDLDQNRKALELLCDKRMLEEESFGGGYSLTRSGFAAMKTLAC